MNSTAGLSLEERNSSISSDQCFVLPDPSLNTVMDRHTTNLVTAIINGLCSPFAVVANFLVVFVIARNGGLHSPSNLLLASLASSDFLVGLLVKPYYIVFHLQEHILHFVPCLFRVIYSESFWVCYGVSFLTLSAISFERYIALRLHLRYKELVTSQHVLKLVVSLWVLEITLTSLEWIWQSRHLRKFHATSFTGRNYICHVCAMLAARFFLRLSSILRFLDFPALWLVRFDYHPSQNKDHQIPNDHMGVLRHDSSIPTRFFAVTLKAVFKRNEGETNSNLNLPISRTTRHGTTVLALPSRVFWMDLTLHMDIESNPDPEEDAVATRRESSLEPYLNYCATTTIAYSRNQLLNLISKYPISQDLLRLLKNQDIFKSRGDHAGVSFRNKIFNIPTSYRPKKDSRFNQVGSNLHIKSLERLNVNKARSPVHPPEIIDLDRIQDSHRLKVLHLNIRSLRNSEHFIQLKELNKRGKFDVITISESWLNTSVSSLEVNLEGYKLSRLDRLHMGGGGVCVYTRNNLKAKVLKDLSSISERNFHQLWISLQWKKTKSTVVCTMLFWCPTLSWYVVAA